MKFQLFFYSIKYIEILNYVSNIQQISHFISLIIGLKKNPFFKLCFFIINMNTELLKNSCNKRKSIYLVVDK